jgi:hypothetical protein
LVKQIDSRIGEDNRLKSFVVLLTSDTEKAAGELRKLAADAGIKNVPLTVHGDPAGVPDYELSRNADVTVVMWSGHRVKAARGFKGDLSEENIRAVMGDVPKVLGK